MSAATRQAIHDSIAAHIADENDGPTEYLTEWIVSASAVVASDDSVNSYWVIAPTGSAYHHQLGLLYRGLEYVTGE